MKDLRKLKLINDCMIWIDLFASRCDLSASIGYVCLNDSIQLTLQICPTAYVVTLKLSQSFRCVIWHNMISYAWLDLRYQWLLRSRLAWGINIIFEEGGLVCHLLLPFNLFVLLYGPVHTSPHFPLHVHKDPSQGNVILRCRKLKCPECY